MADIYDVAYDLSVKADRLGRELGDALGDEYRVKLSAKIGSLSQREDMRSLA